jgi:LPXTG-motif cell wall-anchored protein
MSGPLKRASLKALALVLSVHALSTLAVAAGPAPPPSVPEISPTMITGGLALLAGGVLMLRARRRSK